MTTSTTKPTSSGNEGAAGGSRDLVPAASASLLREMFAGAEEHDPPRPGRYLETPQRLGILPTLHFWNRRDVWKSGRWLFAPLAGASALMTGLAATAVDPWLLPLVGLANGLPVVLAHGLLERYIRRKVRERARLGAGSDRP